MESAAAPTYDYDTRGIGVRPTCCEELGLARHVLLERALGIGSDINLAVFDVCPE